MINFEPFAIVLRCLQPKVWQKCLIVVGMLVRSKWRRRGMNSDRIDQYLYGTSSFGVHTLPPGVDCCDAASVGGWSRARSQRDLCYPGTPQWTQRARDVPPGTYATTLEMRRTGSIPGQYPYIHHAGGSQPILPDVWTTPCPVHGATGTYGRRATAHHIYDMPLIDTDDEGPAQDGNPVSPFYHELEGQAIHLVDGPSPPPRPDGPPGDHDPMSAPFSKI